jgi:hypothetical protein
MDIDTDGDTLADNEYFTKGTSPLLADTDRDGVRDDIDLVPFGDAFITIIVTTIVPKGTDPNDGGSALEPFASITVGGQTAYTAAGSAAPGGTANIYHRFSVNIDDAQSIVPITIRAWDKDTRAGGSDVHAVMEVDKDTSYGGCSGTDTWTFNYAVGAHGHYETKTSPAPCSGATYLRVDPITVTVETVAPDRNPLYLLAPTDYAGLYNVTDLDGAFISYRYVGEPRFVAVLANVTDYRRGTDTLTYLLPRSAFFDTKLYSILNDPAASQNDGVLGEASVSFNGTSGPASDVLHSVVSENVSIA